AAADGRALPAGTWRRIPVAGPIAAKVLERVLRPHAARQREVTAAIVGAIDDLRTAGPAAPAFSPPVHPDAVDQDALGALRRDLGALRAEIEGLRTVIEGNTTRARHETTTLAAGLERAEARLDALEAAAGSRASEAAPAQ
ncbi:MAG: hypothetical protein RLN63_10710, partial [Miltoncostaeaceae bacterium]